MPINFNLGKLAQNLQNAGNSLLGTGLFLATTREINRGNIWGMGYGMGMGCYGGGSIWGCYGGLTGACPPPMDIFHPMYSSMGFNPYYTQAGLAQAYENGRAMAERAMAQSNQLIQKQNPYNNIEADSRIEDAKAGEEVSFVDDKWTELANKENLTDEERVQRDKLYQEGATKLGYGHTKYLDQEYGNKDGELNLEELTAYLQKKYPEESKETLEAKAKNILATIDLNNDNKVSGDEMTAMLVYADELNGDKRDGKIGFDDVEFTTGIMQDEKFNQSIKEDFTNIHKNLFSK